MSVSPGFDVTVGALLPDDDKRTVLLSLTVTLPNGNAFDIAHGSLPMWVVERMQEESGEGDQWRLNVFRYGSYLSIDRISHERKW